jgi:DNA polymerase III sliding clamp (beta) subunit (PCNA family)
VTLFSDDVTIGRKGFTTYLKALAGSNIVKIVPAANGSASESQATVKGVKVVCGSHQGYLPNGAWTSDKTPFTFTEIRVSPSNAVLPNLGSVELAEALSRVLPFTASGEDRPVLQCIKLVVKDGKLSLASADGFRLAIANLDFADSEGWEALIHRDDVKGLIPALKKAKRARLAVEQKSEDGSLLAKYVVIDTELVKYKLVNTEGSFPDYEKVIPTQFNASASFDTKEAIRAGQSLLAMWYDDATKPVHRPLTLTIGDGKLTIEAKEDRGKAEVEAETEGEGKIALDGGYLLESLKACGGIVAFQVVNEHSPMMFSSNGYQVVVMPLFTGSASEQAEQKAEAEGEAVAKAEAEATDKPKRKSKGQRKRK